MSPSGPPGIPRGDWMGPGHPMFPPGGNLIGPNHPGFGPLVRDPFAQQDPRRGAIRF